MVKELHPKFLHWMNTALSEFPAAVGDVSAFIPEHRSLPLHPDHPVTAVSSDELRSNPVLYASDAHGKKVAFAVAHDRQLLGITGDTFQKLAKVVAKICERHDIAAVLASPSVWKLTIGWIVDRYHSTTASDFSEALKTYLDQHVHVRRVWVPIQGLQLEDNMIFAEAVFRHIAADEIYSLFSGIVGPTLNEEAIKAKASIENDYRGRLGSGLIDRARR